MPAKPAGVTIVTDLDRKSFETMTGGIHAKAQRGPATRPIERIRKVE